MGNGWKSENFFFSLSLPFFEGDPNETRENVLFLFISFLLSALSEIFQLCQGQKGQTERKERTQSRSSFCGNLSVVFLK